MSQCLGLDMQQEVNSILTVVHSYFDMLYTANCSIAEQIFYAEAQVQSLAQGMVLSIDREAFKQRMTGRAVPADRHEARDGELLHLDFASPTCAHIKLRSTMLDTLFIDYLTLLKANGQWRIISKVFHAEPASAVKG